MFLRINKPLSIDNLNDDSAEVVAQLEALLASGVEARLDPTRKNFYEVDDTGRVFFIHALPAEGKVMLLASWPVELSLAASVL